MSRKDLFKKNFESKKSTSNLKTLIEVWQNLPYLQICAWVMYNDVWYMELVKHILSCIQHTPLYILVIMFYLLTTLQTQKHKHARTHAHTHTYTYTQTQTHTHKHTHTIDKNTTWYMIAIIFSLLIHNPTLYDTVHSPWVSQ